MCNFLVDTSDTYFLDDIYRDIERLCERYNGILKKEIIGKSVEGRNIVALRLCNSNKVKASVLLTGGIHAREDFSVMLCMKMIDYYCYYYSKENYLDDYNVKSIVDSIDICFIPVSNPDGLNIVHNGLESSQNYEKLKDMKIWGEDHTYWKANANGVDLNKNFDDGNWDIRLCVPGTDVPCSDRFKGFSPNSEPETRALVDFCNKNSFSMMVSYHCSGNCTFWADSGTHDMFEGLDEKIMNELDEKYIYRKTKISQDPAVYGCGFENWFRAKIKRPAFCIELSPFIEGGKQHEDSLFDELVWKYARSTGLFFAKKARKINEEIYGDVERYAALTK
ncbi:hypothetical protein J2Z76_002224 [Sedimentibacter acidaminivorans]|uniref:Peptidase M14 domain-containing protein n=1 Tax=Sedimentibacter acidaminivorans TaxID=913099 RepID=A0ABS4GFA3_9FIRM|nr:M14 family zinc carboxypeptidase [Sedimentibacter acidaminivorans]MBP1926359.1 hypothetical protein [Sedimentibacter acidaminivorans]